MRSAGLILRLRGLRGILASLGSPALFVNLGVYNSMS